MRRQIQVVAVITTSNDADIVAEVLSSLIEDGIGAYVLDAESADGTAAVVESFVGRGVVAVERLPARPSALVTRTQALSRLLEADWFLDHNADEFLESPWPGASLREAMTLVDAAGYNAIGFHSLEFRPTASDHPGGDIRHRMRCFETGMAVRGRVKAWRRGRHDVVLSPHDRSAHFPDRRIFPVQFLQRRYPDRGGPRSGPVPPLTDFDPDGVRAEVMRRNRDVIRLERMLVENQDLADRLTDEGLGLKGQIAELRREGDSLRGQIDRLRSEIEGLHASRSWRLTAPLRALHQRVTRGPRQS